MKVLNFGSLNIDNVYSVEHFVSAGETLSSSRMEQFCGGKGLNQSVAFARAGTDTYHAGCVGKDGDMLLQMLKESNVNTDFVRKVDHTPCGHAIIQVTPEGENCILLYGGANQCMEKDFIEQVLSGFEAGDFLMLQNEINNLDTIIRAANQKGMTVALNPSPFDEKITALDLSLVHWLILNETEGKGITGENEPEKVVAALLKKYPAMRIVLTLGSHGSMYADRTNREYHDIFPAKVVDTTAAGDTFTGFFFSSVLASKSPALALKIASAASSIAVSRKGAAPSIPTIDEVYASGYIKTI